MTTRMPGNFENKRPGNSLRGPQFGASDAKRQKYDGPSASTSGISTGTTANDDMDDFLMSNMGEVNRIENQYSQRLNVNLREVVQEVPGFAQRSLAPLKQSSLNDQRRGDSENMNNGDRDGYIRIEEVRKPLEMYHQEMRRYLREKKQLEDKLREKEEENNKLKEKVQDLDGEIKVVRAQVTSLNKEKTNSMKEQMANDKAHRDKIAELKTAQEAMEEKLQSELMFSKQENEQLREKLRAERRQSGSTPSQQFMTHQINAQSSQNVGTPAKNRTSLPSSGSAFPNKATFYNVVGGSTQQILRRPALTRETGAEMEAVTSPLVKIGKPSMDLVIWVENGVKTRDAGTVMEEMVTPPLPPSIPVPPELVLTERLRERKFKRLALEQNETLKRLAKLKLSDMLLKNRSPLSVC